MLEYYFLFCNYFIVKVCCSCNVDCILKENPKMALSYVYTLYWWSIVASNGSSHGGGSGAQWEHSSLGWDICYLICKTDAYMYINASAIKA